MKDRYSKFQIKNSLQRDILRITLQNYIDDKFDDPNEVIKELILLNDDKSVGEYFVVKNHYKYHTVGNFLELIIDQYFDMVKIYYKHKPNFLNIVDWDEIRKQRETLKGIILWGKLGELINRTIDDHIKFIDDVLEYVANEIPEENKN